MNKMGRKSARVVRGVVVVALGGLLLAGCATVSPSADAPSVVGGTVKSMLQLPLASFELDLSPDGSTIWLASLRPDAPDELFAVPTSTGVVRSYDLPDVDYNGRTTHVRVTSDGAVWVTQPYGVVRVDPMSGHVTSVPFSVDVDGALPGALDAASTLPGTWVTGIVAVGESVWVARNHVPYLTLINPDLTTSMGPTVDPAHAGSADLVRTDDGQTVMLAGFDSTAPAVTIEGKTLPNSGAIGAVRLIEDASGLYALSADEQTMMVLDSKARPPGSTLDWTRSNTAGDSVVYNAADGELVFTSATGSSSLLQLDQREGATSCDGTQTCPTVTTWERVTDFMVAEDGTVWMLRDDGTELAHWEP